MPSEEPDIVVVGAGIIGLAVARELLSRQPERTVTVLEREPVTGFHQTGHNSGVLHAGIYYAPGSLKARLCTEGAPELLAYCRQRGIPARQDGKLIVALSGEERPRLDELERRGRANGVPGLRRLRREEIAEIEPHVRGVDALHSPATAVVDFRAVAEAFARDVRDAGGEVVTGCGVESAGVNGSRIRIRHAQGESRARFAVFCAGGWADRLAVAAGGDPDPRIVPFRGAWLRLRPGLALCGGAHVLLKVAPAFELRTVVPRLGARFALRRRLWAAALLEFPVAGTDRTDLIAGLFAGYTAN